MLKVQSHSTSNANSMTQKAAVEAAMAPGRRALNGWGIPETPGLDRSALNDIAGISCAMPEGAFYVMPNVKNCSKGSVRDSIAFSKLY